MCFCLIGCADIYYTTKRKTVNLKEIEIENIYQKNCEICFGPQLQMHKGIYHSKNKFIKLTSSVGSYNYLHFGPLNQDENCRGAPH